MAVCTALAAPLAHGKSCGASSEREGDYVEAVQRGGEEEEDDDEER